MKLRLSILLSSVVLLSAACESGSGSGDGPVRCSVFYRASVEVAPGAENLVPATNGVEEAVTLGEFRFALLYTDDEYEGRSIIVRVSDQTGMGRVIEQRLFQLGSDSPSNEFVGGHGFTGLSYVYHPTSAGELQYFCESL